MSNHKIFIAGGICMDVVHSGSGGGNVSEKTDGAKIVVNVGGGAVNAALALHKLGCSVLLSGCIGDDLEANLIMEMISRSGLSTDYIEVVPGRSCKALIEIRPDGTAITRADRGVSTSEVRLRPPPRGTKNLFCSSSNIKLIDSFVENVRNTTEVEFFMLVPGKSAIKDLCLNKITPVVDVLCLNIEEAAGFLAFHEHNNMTKLVNSMNHPSDFSEVPEEIRNVIFRETQHDCVKVATGIMNLGFKEVVVTLGRHGVLSSNCLGVFFQGPEPCKVVSTIGAGDAFAATYFYSKLAGTTMKNALRYSCINAASVIGMPDSNSGQLTLSSVVKKLAE